MPRKTKKESNKLDPDRLYAITYMGNASGIQVEHYKFRKDVPQYFKGSAFLLSIPEMKGWGLVFKEVKEEQKKKIEIIRAQQQAAISGPKARWIKSGQRTLKVADKLMSFSCKQWVSVTLQQACVLESMQGFEVR